MRQFDNRTSWLDNEGKPLAGRVKFCKFHTTELENIYNVTGNVPLDNPMFTNTLGQLNNQVFLSDNTNYTVRFEKYVGNGDMTEDEDNWLFQYSCDNLWDIYGINVDASTFQLVNNITDLRALDPNTIATRDNSKVVILGGYNTIGDKPQVMYIWNSSSIESDNGGSVIKVATISTGRWELVNTFDANGVDVRHFGVFGVDSIADATDVMSLQIGYANSYAYSIGLPLYFPANDGLTWYKINNLNIYGSIFAKETRVFGKTGTSSTITVTDDTSYLDVYTNASYKAVFTITGPTVKTSWGKNSTNCVFNPTYKLIVDSVINTNNKSFSNIVLDCQYELVENVALTNCQINAVKKLGDNSTFIGCKLTESMFTDACDFASITVYDSDIIDIADWPTTSKWLILRQQNSLGPLDFEGRTIDSSCNVTWTSNVTYKNAVFSGFNIIQNTAHLDNCSGTFTCTANLKTLYIENSVVSTTTNNIALTGLYAKNSTISFGNHITANTVYLYNTILQDANYNYICQTFTAEKSTLGANIYSPVMTVLNCDVYGTLVQNSTTNVLDFNIIGNKFYSGNGHNISSTVANTVVVGKWCDNTSLLNQHFVLIDRTNIDLDETHHNYTYLNNTGKYVLQRDTIKWIADIDYLSTPNMVNEEWDDPISEQTMNLFSYMGERDADATTPSIHLTTFSMFTVGINNIGNLSIKAYLPNVSVNDSLVQKKSMYSYTSFDRTICDIERTKSEWTAESQIGTYFRKGYAFLGGYTWGITSLTFFVAFYGNNATRYPSNKIPTTFIITRL